VEFSVGFGVQIKNLSREGGGWIFCGTAHFKIGPPKEVVMDLSCYLTSATPISIEIEKQ